MMMERITIEMVNKAPTRPPEDVSGDDPFASFFNFDSRGEPGVWIEYFSPPSILHTNYATCRDETRVMSPSPNMRIGFNVNEILFQDRTKSVSRSHAFFRAIKIDDVFMHETIEVGYQEAFEPSNPISNFNDLWEWTIIIAIENMFIRRVVRNPVFDNNQTVLDFWNGDAHLSLVGRKSITHKRGVIKNNALFRYTKCPDEIVEQIRETFDHYVFGDAMTAAYALAKMDALGG